MATLRIHQAGIVTTPTLRIHDAKIQGSVTSLTLRIHSAKIQGASLIPLSIQPIADLTLEAFAPDTITPAPGATSPTPQAYAWEQVSGPPVTWVDNGTSISYIAPPVLAGCVLIFGVTGLLNGQVSTQIQVTRTVLPHINWKLQSDHVWYPRRNRVAL